MCHLSVFTLASRQCWGWCVGTNWSCVKHWRGPWLMKASGRGTAVGPGPAWLWLVLSWCPDIFLEILSHWELAFLNLITVGWIFPCCGAVMCIVRCLAFWLLPTQCPSPCDNQTCFHILSDVPWECACVCVCVGGCVCKIATLNCRSYSVKSIYICDFKSSSP